MHALSTLNGGGKLRAPRVVHVIDADPVEFVHPDVRYTAKGYAILNVLAVTAILEHDPRWAGTLRYNEFAERIEIYAENPIGRPDDGEVIVWKDDHETEIVKWLERVYEVTPAATVVYRAVVNVTGRNVYNPVTEYLDSVRGTWDGVKRFDTFASTYLGSTEGSEAYRREIARTLFLAAIARAYRPGVKADKVVVLEGPQGGFKSTLIKVLYTWTTDSDIDLKSKDKYLVLRGQWAVELAEIDKLGRQDPSALKAFISSATDTYRPPYGRAVIENGRRSIFVGTTNRSEWLSDHTGGRRFDVIRVGFIDIERVKRDRDQLWAEAVALYDTGELHYTTDAEVMKEQAIVADTRTVEETWAVKVRKWLAEQEQAHAEARAKGPSKLPFAYTPTIDQIWTSAIGGNVENLTPQARTRLGIALAESQWLKRRICVNGVRWFVYEHVGVTAVGEGGT